MKEITEKSISVISKQQLEKVVDKLIEKGAMVDSIQ